ncbi:hypothetical protein JKA74_07790 [Marivirga sp. S37H4]|uniref:Uncharacterized protein n=1 Tax=Marivirga aurantiaca TaxID=2802615 RepID=A0A934WXR1_9BACT|nr:hypothetical protein [Marivirga aurantiaca]MBK6264934.1 hypothetical protein [Marivirga aurantiaca]
MTIQDLINFLSESQYIILAYFCILFIATLILSTTVNRNNFNRLKYVASVIVYGVCIPGILAAVLTFYMFFILSANLLELNVMIYFLPIIFMVLSLFILSKKIGMKAIPGFGKLSALMILIGTSFFIIFVLQRTYFGVVFLGGIIQLLIAFVCLFLILKYAWSRLIK